MLTTQRCQQLVDEFRSYVGSTLNVRWPVLRPAATAKELNEVERQLGFRIPTELRTLYGLCRRAYPLMTFDLHPPERIVRQTDLVADVLSELASQGLLTTDPWDPDDVFWIGDPPQGNCIVFGSGTGQLAIEADGPCAGRILFIDVRSGANYRWCPEARSLEEFLELQVEIAQQNLIWVSQYANNTTAQANRDAGIIEDGDMIILSIEEAYDDDEELVEPYLGAVTALTAKYGGTGAFFFMHYPEPEHPV